MNTRLDLKQWVVILITLVLVTAVGLFILNSGTLPSIELPVGLSADVSTAEELFDYDEAVNTLTFRWQAMADFYEKNGLLTRDTFDYDEAAENLAYRWQALAKFYDDHGLLNKK